MTSTPPKFMEDSLCDSWVELNAQSCVTPPDRTTPLPFATSEEYLRLLKEAQRESGQSSAQISKASSRIDTPRESGSPKSPPNSPNTELSTGEDPLKGVYINYSNKDELVANFDKSTDWIWDWSSRPDQAPPKDWKFRHPKSKKSYSMRYAKVGKNSLFSKEVMYTLFVSNIISILLGTGVGMWLSRRGIFIATLSVNWIGSLLPSLWTEEVSSLLPSVWEMSSLLPSVWSEEELVPISNSRITIKLRWINVDWGP